MASLTLRGREPLCAVLMVALLSLAACARGGVLQKVGSLRADVAYDVTLGTGRAYLAGNHGVSILDIGRPEKPREIGEIPTDTAFGVFAAGDLVYVAGGPGLVIADVRDPAHPLRLGEYASSGVPEQVRLEGTTAYLATSRGLEIVDVRDPGAPTLMGRLTLSGGAQSVAVRDSFVYLANPCAGLEVIDVSVPSAPAKVSTVAETQGAWDIHIQDEMAFVGCHDAGVRVLDLSDGDAPRVVGRFYDDDSGEALGVWGDGERLFVSDNYQIEVLDIADPAHPFEIGQYERVNGAHDLIVDGTLVYVAEGRQGLIILEYGTGYNR